MHGPCVISTIERPPRDLTAALAEFDVATVHEAYGRRGLMLPEIRPIAQGQRVCGPAVTALNHAGDNLMVHAAMAACQPGDVLVVATTAPSTHGMLGELMATQCRAQGIAAVVLDAGTRDSARLREMGFPVWARAISAAGTAKATPGWVNVAVVCGGVRVNPGDLVLGDDDGVVVVAREHLADVLEAARARVAREQVARERYERGELSLDVNNLREVLERLRVAGVEGLARSNGSATGPRTPVVTRTSA
jgi:4-hydroxy-4-methyl-2-oxoglutarate aldolase